MSDSLTGQLQRIERRFVLFAFVTLLFSVGTMLREEHITSRIDALEAKACADAGSPPAMDGGR